MTLSKPLRSAILFSLTVGMLSACGGGAGGGTDSDGGFTSNNPNTKPQSSLSNSSQAVISSAASSKSSSSSRATSGGDITPPAQPAKLTVVSTFNDVIFLSWEQSSDNVGIAGYKVYRDGIQIAETEAFDSYFADYTVAASRTYEYGISAGDAVGNWSKITPISATTPAGNIPTNSSASSVNVSSSVASSATSIGTSSAISTSSSSTSSNGSSTQSSKSSGSAQSSKSTSSTQSSKSSSSAATLGVLLQWQRPLFRENGVDMFEHEIARYEIRYKLPNETAFTITLVTSPLLTKSLPDVPSNAYFEIATVDTNGAYSRFIPITPH